MRLDLILKDSEYMKIGVVLNPHSGRIQVESLKTQIQEALYRCEIKYYLTEHKEQLESLLLPDLIHQKINTLLICGGDGTINLCLQTLMKLRESHIAIPEIAIIPSGTANDLASELKLNSNFKMAARSALSEKIKKIDVIEVQADNKKQYMLTNGGVGIAALTAEYANQFKTSLKKTNFCNDPSEIKQLLGQIGQKTLKQVGHHIYSMAFMYSIGSWCPKNWKIQIDMGNENQLITTSPYILINNQPRMGKSFEPAPHTRHNDGTFNLWISEMKKVRESFSNIMDIRKGILNTNHGLNKSFEIQNCTIQSLNPSRKINFFGDGEILFKDILTTNIKIHKQTLPLLMPS